MTISLWALGRSFECLTLNLEIGDSDNSTKETKEEVILVRCLLIFKSVELSCQPDQDKGENENGGGVDLR